MHTLKNLRIVLISFILFYSMLLIISTGDLSTQNTLTGLSFAFFVATACLISEKLLTKSKLLNFNALILGLFAGLMFGTINNLIIEQLIAYELQSSVLMMFIRPAFTLLGIYLGVILTVKKSEQIYFSIPFVRLNTQKSDTKNILISSSALSDPRIIDLFSCGILDRIIIPKFIIENSQNLSEIKEQEHPHRKILGVYKKLQTIPDLDIEMSDIDFTDLSEDEKLLKIAKATNANILTADPNNIKEKNSREIKIINIHSLSNALKPLMFTGERLQITIQRYGKEPRQGIGYLEDGAMVVVNGGGDSIGEKIDATVLSVKHTSSGRIIFCNAIEKNSDEPSYSM